MEDRSNDERKRLAELRAKGAKHDQPTDGENGVRSIYGEVNMTDLARFAGLVSLDHGLGVVVTARTRPS